MMFDTPSKDSLDDRLEAGATVYDTAGEKVGTFEALDREAGYLTVRKGWMFHSHIYVPLSLLAAVGEESISLSISNQELQQGRFESPPHTADEAASSDVPAGERTIRAAAPDAAPGYGRTGASVSDADLALYKERQQKGEAEGWSKGPMPDDADSTKPDRSDAPRRPPRSTGHNPAR